MKNDVPLLTKWVSRKLAVLILFYTFVSNSSASGSVKITAASVITGLWVAGQTWIDRYNPHPESAAPPIHRGGSGDGH